MPEEPDEDSRPRQMRLHKLLAHAGVASRRAAERLIEQGRVRVNDERVRDLGRVVDPEQDRVTVDGQPIAAPSATHVYIALNKPLGVVSTADDPEGRPTVLDVVRLDRRVYPVGRLDIDSEGLILLTDDGDLTYRLTQARYGVEKEYHVLVAGVLGGYDAQALEDGVELEDGPARALRAQILQRGRDATWLRVVLVEGRQRQVRRMLAALGFTTLRLRRERIGPVPLGELRPGAWRYLRAHDVAALRAEVGLLAERGAA